jgi:Transglycosylase SLT domain
MMPGRNARSGPWPCACISALLLSPAALAREDASDLCLQAASDAARQTGVPYEVLLAISKVETGREGRPWPWTVNFAGEGHWFESAAEAEAGVTEAIDRGATNVDVGCFQLNYRWHSDGFASVADMLDPVRNATYAATFLASQFDRTGDWASAAAAYHSGTPEYAELYQAKFEAAYAGLDASDPQPETMPVAEQRTNGFPLLMAGTAGRNGSLVPTGSGGLRLIGAP